MLKSAIRTAAWSAVLVTVLAAVLGGLIEGWHVAAVAKGAGLGFALGCAMAIHLAFRTINRRTPEAHNAELQADSFEFQLLQRAGAGAFTDTISLGILACVLALASPDTKVGSYALFGLMVAAIVDFIVRSVVLWQRGGAA